MDVSEGEENTEKGNNMMETESDTGNNNNNPPSYIGANTEENSPAELKLPWPALQKFFKNIKMKNNFNYSGDCVFCKKTYSCSRSSASNFEKHLKKHPGQHTAYEKAKSEIAAQQSAVKRQRVDSGGSSGHTAPDYFRSPGSLVSQAKLDSAVLQYVVMESLPFSTVESPYFRAVALLGLKPSLHVMTRKTLVKKLEEKKKEMKDALMKTLDVVEHVSTTADAWTKNRRSYLGMTVHWIDPESLERRSAALAVRRLTGRHTSDVLASCIDEIHKEFALQNKVVKTTTDNGANFVKAFRVHAVPAPSPWAVAEVDSEEAPEGSNLEDADDENFECLELANMLESDPDNLDVVTLPPHERCGSHSLNLVAAKDSLKAQDSPAFKKVYHSCMTKLRKLWTRQNMSTQMAENVHKLLGVYLTTPNDTRWNSEYDSVLQVSKLAEKDVNKLHRLCDIAGLARLTDADIRFLVEYTRLMGFVARSLDILQAEKKMFYGYLAPTIESLRKNIQDSRSDTSGTTSLVYCEPLAAALLGGITKRFGAVIQEENTILAACVHPKFKQMWIDSRSESGRASKLLKEAVKAEVLKAKGQSRAPDEHFPNAPSAIEVVDPQDDDDEDFFSFPSSRTSQRASPENEAEDEIRRFAASSSKDVSSLSQSFPYLRKIFLKLNTPLPSSAAVERLFSLAGLVFSAKRARLTDENMETEVLLKTNQAIVKLQ